jgi:ATP-dependent helicase/nuclease subunit A
VGRIAAQLERLSVGDESNAAIDARDAVRLMTVHAAKGLEFPVVFLVNLGKGIGGYRDPIRVTGDPDRGDIAVAVGEFRSAADDDDVLREREETKRLLYVGLTRARDRLYLSAMLKDGSLKIGRGSLAEVLPASLRSLFAVSATGASPVVWSSSSGATHTFRCLTEAPVDQPEGAERALEGGDGTPVMPAAVASVADDFGALVDHHATAHGLTVTPAPSPLSAVAQGADSDRLTGVLVHRLLQRLGLSVACDLATVRELAGRLVRPEDDGDGASGEAIERAATLFLSLSAREDVRRIYLSGRPFHEVPFTTMVEGVPVRGVVDCLVSHADGATILEFKTGRPRPEHQSQVEVYRRAMESALPGIPIDVALVYAQNTGT